MTLADWAPAIVALGGTIFTAGMLVSKVKDHDKRLDNHDTTIGDHARQLNEHALELAEQKGWRKGYEAAGAGHS